ncbi:hypothetical protein ACTXT7_011895 [Hymenolepis weldensis]
MKYLEVDVRCVNPLIEIQGGNDPHQSRYNVYSKHIQGLSLWKLDTLAIVSIDINRPGLIALR